MRALANRCGICQKPVAQWKKRASIADVPAGPDEARSKVPSLEEDHGSTDPAQAGPETAVNVCYRLLADAAKEGCSGEGAGVRGRCVDQLYAPGRRGKLGHHFSRVGIAATPGYRVTAGRPGE